MEEIERPIQGEASANIEWGSDIAARMLRVLDVPYIALNPGASFRGFHDSLVNLLGNRDPQMLLCLHEDHAVAIAHGYAKATDRPMACVLHSNVGLLHGSMGIFNAWCDRVPMLILGATGPVEPQKRRPWIDWIHTMRDQGALLRAFVKWDDEPRSPEGIVEALLRGAQLTLTQPCAPVYICLDAGLQERKLDRDVTVPEPGRYRPAAPPRATDADVETVADLLANAARPLLLFGRGSRRQADWDRRVRLAELCGASVLTSIRERSVFPTEHGLHVAPPFYWARAEAKEVIKAADVIVSLDWVDLNGLLLQVMRRTDRIAARTVHVSLDSILHNGASMDYFSLPPVDVPIMAGADVFIEQLLPAMEHRLGARPRWDGVNRDPTASLTYSKGYQTEIAPRDIEVALATVRKNQRFTLAHVTIGWAGDAYAFRDPLDFLGHDGGAGLGAGPGLTVGAALALKDSGRLVISVLGDGDFLQGATALWTAGHYKLPVLFIVSNNRSNFNDETHQDTMARIRGRPRENRWIGQRIDQSPVDFAGLARAQGVAAEGPVATGPALEAAIARGLEVVRAGQPYLIDALVTPGYASTPLSRGE